VAFLQVNPPVADDADKKALDTAIELTKQLIALATGVITVMAALLGIFKPVHAALVPALASSVYFEVLWVPLRSYQSSGSTNPFFSINCLMGAQQFRASSEPMRYILGFVM
jgi:hypothetical protein